MVKGVNTVPGQGILQILLMLALQALAQGPSRPAQLQTSRNPHGPLDIPCENCHTSTSWKPIRSIPEFDHDKTRYPLRGMHEKVQCVECHTKLVFKNVGSTCADCHADIHRRQFGANCEQCHTVNGWNVSVQAIQNHFNRFPLVGAHAALECDACHKGAATGQFQGLSTQCYSCHARDFQLAANPNHVNAKFSTTCETCHGMNTWLAATFDHSTTGFMLTNGHANVPCASCHVNNNYNLVVASTDCGNSGCHLTTWQQTTNPVHPSAGPAFGLANCTTCHTTISWTTATFDHSTTGFMLTNGHANVACATCHINNNYNLTTAPTDCGNSGCHLTTWQRTTNPVHPTAGASFGIANCSTCHSTVNWTTATFDHSTTGFMLTNGHANVACALCHTNNNYSLTTTPNDCGNSGCHLTTWQQTKNPVHSTSGAQFAATNCAVCHTTVSWTTAVFDHSTTGFALIGTHLSPTPTPCASCHVNNNYTLSSADCYGCHQAVFQSTTTLGGNVPNHVTAGFPITASACATCHAITTWAAGVFDHSATGFQLTNAHANVACNLCHVNNNYALTITPTDCGNSGCHLTTWQQTTNPVHPTAGATFAATNCSTCHTTISWTTATFDHSTTGFALTGTHMSPTPTPCVSCHVSNNYTLSSTDCYGCHQAAFTSTTTLGGNVPNHVAAGFPITAAQCAACHTITTWAAGVFNHATTGFALTNAHANATCVSCHIGNNYALTIAPTDCGNSGCHLTTWQQTNAPPHASAGATFAAANCATCHTTVNFTTATFDHGTTGFALTGLHMSPSPSPCISCHVSNNYTLTSTACYGCHITSWQSTATLGGVVPNHITAGFPTDCSICHTTSAWTGGVFNHTATGFPLTGFHATVACAGCHVNNNYSITVTTCVSCHLNKYTATTTPNHVQVGFPQTCETCHTTAVWTGAIFDHNTTTFPLTGYHATSVPCASCHVNNNYTSLPITCYGCHTATYNATTNPAHAAAGFPTTCATCHTTAAWTGATFNHTYFPVNHGNANGVCATCHTNPANYLVFQCTQCHGGGNAANFNHPNLSGYVYNSVNCYQCHKR